jgi:hypothetical protein
MMRAAREGHLEIVSLLIERGANMDLQDNVRLYHPSLPRGSLLTIIILYSPEWVDHYGVGCVGLSFKDSVNAYREGGQHGSTD